MSILNNFTDKNLLHISDSDLDGNICSLLAEYYIKPIAKTYVRYNTGDRALPDLNFDVAKKSNVILFTDITPPTVEMYNKLKEFSEVIICDHHITSKNDLGELPNYYFDITKCASKIFYEQLTKGTRVKKIVAQLIELTDTYDRYQINSLIWRNAKALNNILYACVDWRRAQYQNDTEKYQRFLTIQLQKIESSKEFHFTAWEKDQALKAEEKERKNYQQAKKSLKIRQDNSGNKYGYFECSSKVSWTASLLLREYPDINYFVCHSTFLENYRHEENGKISLRSQDGFDISGIAKKWGGGGHVNASGLELQLDDFYKIKQGNLHLI